MKVIGQHQLQQAFGRLATVSNGWPSQASHAKEASLDSIFIATVLGVRTRIILAKSFTLVSTLDLGLSPCLANLNVDSFYTTFSPNKILPS